MIEVILLIATTIKEYCQRHCGSFNNPDMPCRALEYISGSELFDILQNATINKPVANFSGFVSRNANYP